MNVRSCVILYAVESTDRSRQQQLLSLANRLNDDGVDTEIDQYHGSPPEGWNLWMERVAAERCLLITCTEVYLNRFNLRDTSGAGGVLYEARLVRERLKADKGLNSDIIPIVLGPDERKFVPIVLKDVTCYDVSSEEGYEALYARLTGRQIHDKPTLGKIRPLRNSIAEHYPLLSSDDVAVRAEIAVALERLLSAMRRTFIRGAFTIGEWQALHDDLDQRVRNRGARSLGDQYSPFCKALDYDQFSINYQLRLAREFDAKASTRDALGERELKAQVREHDAFAMQNIASDVQTLAPFLRYFGQGELADRLEYVATAQLAIAERYLTRPPEFP